IGISEEAIKALEQQYGFDKPVLVRYGLWLKNIVTLNFGDSFTYEEPVLDLIISKFPVSLQFGFLSIILTYLICVPLGVWRAVKDGTRWDGMTSFALFVLYSIPPVMLGILLRTFLAGEAYLGWFPIHGLHSEGYESLSLWGKI